MKIALTGATGLVGSRFYDLLKSNYEIVPISSSFKIDITDKNKIHKFLKNLNPAIIVHLAAKTNVDQCEDDKKEDRALLKKEKILTEDGIGFENIDPAIWKGSGSAFGINVVGTKNLADYAREADIKMVYVSTDFVFNGDLPSGYSEDDPPNPINWYGQTKLWGEQVLGPNSLTTRISYPYGYKNPVKKDLIWKLVEILEQVDSPRLVFDQVITPTFIDDIVRGIQFLIEKNELGLIDLCGNNFLSPYEIGVAVAREFNLNEGKIQTIKRDELYKGRAPRPFKVTLKNDRIKNLGFEITDFIDALKMIKQ